MTKTLDAWAVRLCGQLDITRRDGTPVASRLPGRQGRLLFAYLLANRDRACPRGELLELLWPGQAPGAADTSLSALLSKLRRALGEGALVGRSDLRLDLAGGARIDTVVARDAVTRAEAALAAGDHADAARAAQTALAVDLLAFLPGADGDWVQQQRRELETLRVRALEAAATAGITLGGPAIGEAEQAARAAVDAAPFRESAYRLLMEALAAGGNEAEALLVFDQLRTLLREELGVAPGPQVQELHCALLHSERAAPAPTTTPEAPETLGRPWPATLDAVLDRSVLINREHELHVLRSCWEQAQAGTRTLVSIAGEAGIGKTRLAAELAREAHAAGALVLYGRCEEETVGPYQPFVDLLRGFASDTDNGRALLDRLGPRGQELARLLPEFAAFDADAAVPELLRDAHGQRFRLFSAIGALLAEVGERSPLLVILDDLHWADRPTLKLLRHLARALRPERFMLLGTYREAELEADHPLPLLLGDLRREAGLRRLALEGLDGRAVAALVAELAGAPASPAFVDALRGETEGNPFFIEEVLRHLRETASDERRPAALLAAGVPEGVREVTARRLARLTADARATVGVAAAIGRDVDFDVLETVAPLQGDALLAALEEALAARVLREVPGRPGRYAFTHALVRAAVYDELSALRRARLHGRIGEALERLRAHALEDHLAQIAHHYGEAAAAGEPQRAVDFALRAGRRAETLLAHEEAAEHYAAALRAHDLLGSRDDGTRCDILIALGTAQQRSGEETAEEVFERAAVIARALGDGRRLALAALGFAGPWTQIGLVREDRVRLLEEALDALDDADSPLLARVLARLSLELYYAPGAERRMELSERALAMARRLGDPAVLAACLDARHYALWRPENSDERLAVVAEATALAEAAGDNERLLESLGWTVVDQLERGNIEEVDRLIERAVRLAETAHLPLYLWWTSLFVAMRALLRGDFEDAERLALEALALGQRGQADNAVSYFAMQMYTLRREQGRLDEVLEPVKQFAASYTAVPAWRALIAHALTELGELTEARERFEELARAGFDRLPRDANWLIAVTLLAETAVELGDAQRAAELYELLLPYRDAVVVVGRAASCNGAAARLLGVLAACTERWSLAAEHFDAALAAHAHMGARPWQARTQLAYAEMLAARAGADDLDRAVRLAGEALGLASATGMVPVAARAAALRERCAAAKLAG